MTARGGKGLVGGRGRQHDQVDRLRLDAGIGQRRARCMDGEIGGRTRPGAAIWRSRMPVRWTIHSSDVSTVCASSALVTTRLRQIGAAAEHNGTHNGHEAAPAPTGGSRAPWVMAKSLADLGEEVVADHVIADIDGDREPLCIGAAMAFDNDAIKPQENAAIGFGRIHLFAQRSECAVGRADSPASNGAVASAPRAKIRRSAGRCLPRPSARCCRQSLPSRPRRRSPCRCRRPQRSREYCRCGHGCSRRMRAASRTGSNPFTSSTPILSRPTVGFSRSAVRAPSRCPWLRDAPDVRRQRR